MYTLENLEPKVVFDHFKKICEIPHGSENTKELSDYLVEFGKENGCEVYQDEHCNVVIYKAASEGYEDADAVILQAHIDMVCQKTENSDFDFEKDAIKLAIDGENLVAEETTLGADNGIAVAMMMAVIENKEMAHPRLECVFTSDEEVGLIGAELLDPKAISARKMINLDSEEEGSSLLAALVVLLLSVRFQLKEKIKKVFFAL
jgi:dipeptidase D